MAKSFHKTLLNEQIQEEQSVLSLSINYKDNELLKDFFDEHGLRVL